MDSDFKTELIATLFGALYGLLYMSAIAANGGVARDGFATLVMVPLLIHLFRRSIFEFLARSDQSATALDIHKRYELYPYALFLLAGLACHFAVPPTVALTLGVGLAIVITQGLLYFAALGKEGRRTLALSQTYIALLFLVSGFSALIYQVVWQRTLFVTFGINSESVTVIVSVFMFGLGIGSLLGGLLQKRFPRHLLQLFLFLEMSIGAFGLVSMPLIHWVSAASGAPSTQELAMWVYLILAFPTLLMGATLPILVSWLQGYLHNMGKSVGLLYAFNAVGSAIAAFCTVQLLFVFFGQQVSLLIAAFCNLATAALIYDASNKIKSSFAAKPAEPVPADIDQAVVPAPAGLPWIVTFLTLLAIGYVSLSQEILWFRLLGFMTGNLPDIFGMVVAAVLAGIAAGSLASKKVCEPGGRPIEHLVGALVRAIVVFYLALPLVAYACALMGKGMAVLLAYGAIAMVAFYTGGILPMLIHLGMDGSRGNKTQAMSWLYFANIIGATLGPLVTGFILLDRYTLEQNIAVLTAMTMLLLFAIVLAVPKPASYKAKIAAMMLLAIGAGWLAHAPLYDQHLEKLQYAHLKAPRFKHTIENRDGILTIEAGPEDIMYGGGIYDGRFNLNPLTNGNGIDRAFMIASLHRKPERVLEIGLSTGSWARVVTKYAPLKELTIVEINRGYPAAMAPYPDIAEVLTDPRVKLVIDDGRRWLRRRPDEKFDLILMNTSFYWRSNSTNLLSAEFLELARQHLKPGGVFYYNTTGSKDVVHTAAHVFKHVTMYKRFVACSDSPFDMTELERRANLLQFNEHGGKPVFDQDARHQKILTTLSQVPLPDLRQESLATQGLWRVTDDNMAIEYKVGGR
jgi:spermidine synthase